MTTLPIQFLCYRGVQIGESADDFEYMRDSADIVHDADALRARMQ